MYEVGIALTIRVRDFYYRVVLEPVALVDSIELFVVRITSEHFNQEYIFL